MEKTPETNAKGGYHLLNHRTTTTGEAGLPFDVIGPNGHVVASFARRIEAEKYVAEKLDEEVRHTVTPPGYVQLEFVNW